MSLPEVGHRVLRGLRAHAERSGALGTAAPPARVTRSPASLLAPSSVESTAYRDAAEELLRGRQDVFGISLRVGAAGPEWNRDPLTGTLAPLTFGKLIDYRDEQLVGNIKYLWEPNRHLELVTLAQAYFLTGERRFLDGLSGRLSSWLDQCPYPMGVNWTSSLEVGIRLINWSLVWELIGRWNSPLFADEQGSLLLERWLESVYQHVYFIRHHYSRYSSANNHLIGEAAGVFVATCCWPYWEDFDRSRDEARRILIDAADTQTHSDGVNREQAVAYQQFVLDFFVLSALAGRSYSAEFPERYWQTIERMLEYIQSLIDVGGNVPMIGDADDGFVVRLSQEADFCPFRSLLATGALLFDRPDFAAKSARLDDKTRFLLGGDGWPAVLRKANGTSGAIRREFPHGGYYVLGTDLETCKEIRAVVDAGPLGYLSIAAHGHADALSLVLSVAGREILTDPGTYSYHTEPLWRAYFRGTAAHNTVRVDGQDQSVQAGNFMWLHHANACCLEFDHHETGSRFVGRHDGYARLNDPVVHQRAISQTGASIEVLDRLECRTYHRIERYWHFSEQCAVSLEGSTVRVENGPVKLALRPAEPETEVRHLRGSVDPPGGWISRRFDVKVPADSVSFVNDIQGSTELKTLIECELPA